ncbi:MAG: FAD-dependent monooxygenase [Hormoscilla sp. GUM202]|nr:FAD-dependent monooxygenase [Hormoscilla sp. GUM202]
MEIKQVTSPVVNKVAIVGGGIGGLATAVALRKQGIDAHVYEKARELRPVGASLGLAPNGLKSLEAVDPGIVEKLKEKGSQVSTIIAKTPTGQYSGHFGERRCKAYSVSLWEISPFFTS